VKGVEIEGVDAADLHAVQDLLRKLKPHEIYNLAGKSFVADSTDDLIGSTRANALIPAVLLEAMRQECPAARFVQASTSMMFDARAPQPFTEATPLAPATPYAVAKTYGHFLTGTCREQHRLFACSAILFNHESERRGESFVSRKITRAAAEFQSGRREKLAVGNIDVRRDWGYAPDTVRALWLMLQQDAPGDYVVCTGELHSVREMLKTAFDAVGLNWEEHVVVDPRFVRPGEPEQLSGDASKARRRLGWAPSVGFHDMIRGMVAHDREQLKRNELSALHPDR
jgi:GDPmannose 4,6-dehydratase